MLQKDYLFDSKQSTKNTEAGKKKTNITKQTTVILTFSYSTICRRNKLVATVKISIVVIGYRQLGTKPIETQLKKLGNIQNSLLAFVTAYDVDKVLNSIKISTIKRNIA